VERTSELLGLQSLSSPWCVLAERRSALWMRKASSFSRPGCLAMLASSWRWEHSPQRQRQVLAIMLLPSCPQPPHPPQPRMPPRCSGIGGSTSKTFMR
jgi:hypothetical protein